jgi:hypothetical protein
MPAILATWEAEIERITVQGQPRNPDPILKIFNTKEGWWTG